MGHDDNGSAAESASLDFDEDALVERIKKRFANSREGSVGIGDDAAILSDPSPVVLTTDLLIEGIDFFPESPLWFTGRKSLAANLSDLAAMGARPDSFLLTLGVPRARFTRLDELFDGLESQAKRFGIDLVGGDLSEAERLLISITATGRLESGKTLLRSGAGVGDSIFVSRPLGGPAAGLDLLRKGWSLNRNLEIFLPEKSGYELKELGFSLLRAQLDPEPEVELGMALAKLDSVGACMDLSDGLSRDLPRLCSASGVGALIDWDRVPIVSDLDRLGARLGVDPAHCALHGGEEFSLIFTARGGEAELSGKLGRPVYKIGRVEQEEGVRLNRGGRIAPLPQLGFDHFR